MQPALPTEITQPKHANFSTSPPVSPLPFVALSVVSYEAAPPLQGLCKGFQTPLYTGGSLSRKAINKGWPPQVWRRTKADRQEQQNFEKAAIESRIEALSAEPLAAATAGVRPGHAGEAASAGGVSAAAPWPPDAAHPPLRPPRLAGLVADKPVASVAAVKGDARKQS
jgi:hypothetical protein